MSISDLPTRHLFDLESTHSFVALQFAPRLLVALAFMEIDINTMVPNLDLDERDRKRLRTSHLNKKNKKNEVNEELQQVEM